jgi:hypothetical protein
MRDPDVSPEAKLVLGAFAARPFDRPTRPHILDAMPFLDNPDYTAGLLELRAKRIAFEDFSRCKFGKPVKVIPLTEHADTRRPGAHVAFIPVASLRKLAALPRQRERRAPADALLIALYHLEQRRRHGIQMPDNVAAALLGWSESAVTRARNRLKEAEVIEEIKPASGRHGAAVYAIPDALPGAEGNFDPDSDDRFDESRTRYLRKLPLDADTTITVLASAAEEQLLEMRLEEAGGRIHAEVSAFAAAARPFLRAKELLDGPLSEAGLKRSVVTYPNGVGVTYPDGNYLSRSSLSSLSSAGSAGEGEGEPKDQAARDELARDEHAPARRTGKAAGEEETAEELPQAGAALQRALPDNPTLAARIERTSLRDARTLANRRYGAHWINDNEREMNPVQLVVLDAYAAEQIDEAARRARSQGGQPQALMIAYLRNLPHRDELRTRLEAVSEESDEWERAAFRAEAAREGWELVDKAELDELLGDLDELHSRPFDEDDEHAQWVRKQAVLARLARQIREEADADSADPNDHGERCAAQDARASREEPAEPEASSEPDGPQDESPDTPARLRPLGINLVAPEVPAVHRPDCACAACLDAFFAAEPNDGRQDGASGRRRAGAPSVSTP